MIMIVRGLKHKHEILSSLAGQIIMLFSNKLVDRIDLASRPGPAREPQLGDPCFKCYLTIKHCVYSYYLAKYCSINICLAS